MECARRPDGRLPLPAHHAEDPCRVVRHGHARPGFSGRLGTSRAGRADGCRLDRGRRLYRGRGGAGPGRRRRPPGPARPLLRHLPQPERGERGRPSRVAPRRAAPRRRADPRHPRPRRRRRPRRRVGAGRPQGAGRGDAPGRAPPARGRRPRRLPRLARGRARRRVGRDPRPRPVGHLPPPEPHRVPQRRPRPAGGRDRRRRLPARRRLELRLRQHRRRPPHVAGADGALPRRRPHHQPARGGQPAAGHVRRHLGGGPGPAAARPGRAAALRHPRGPLHRAPVPAGRRLRRPHRADRHPPAARGPRPRGDRRRRARRSSSPSARRPPAGPPTTPTRRRRPSTSACPWRPAPARSG